MAATLCTRKLDDKLSAVMSVKLYNALGVSLLERQTDVLFHLCIWT